MQKITHLLDELQPSSGKYEITSIKLKIRPVTR